MKNTLEYWKKRCELAEKVMLLLDNCEPSYSEKVLIGDMYDEWEDFKNSAEAGIEQESIEIELNDMAEKFYPENPFEELYQKED